MLLKTANGEATTPEEIRDHWTAINSMNDAQTFSNGQEIMTHLMGVLGKEKKRKIFESSNWWKL